jgi:FkbH-like protein
MSLMQLRTDWLRVSRAATAAEDKRDRIVVAATFTAEPIVPYLGARLVDDPARPPVLTIAPYNQLFQLCHNWQTDYADHTPEVIVILWRIEDLLRNDFQSVLRGGSDAAIFEKVGELADAVAQLRKTFGGRIVCSIPPFPHQSDHDISAISSPTTVGSLHRKVVDLWVSRINEINNVGLLDLDGMQRYAGIEASLDWRKWYLYRQPYSEAFWDRIAEGCAALIRSQSTASKKCVVVDCDNTLWGGIIGEDGLGGIQISEDHPGSIFRDFQEQLKTLRSQGVMIALCSKNNEADVWEVFDKHDGMVLKRDDVVAARINWIDKPANIASLAEELNIGLDSFVFVDDNPMEIEHVRAALPMVTCILVPTELTTFPREFGAYRGFDRDKVSSEDRLRSDMMLQEKKRRDLATAVSPEEFRRDLQLKIDVFEVRDEHISRVVQLINKSNQFNLTTRRKTEAELTRLLADPNHSVLAWRVSDRFGDYGLVGVAILEHEGESSEIETLLMSCRVLGRGVEKSVFAAVSDLVSRRGTKQLVGSYFKTNKNQLVAGLYADYGFEQISPERWVLDDMAKSKWPEEIGRLGL